MLPLTWPWLKIGTIITDRAVLRPTDGSDWRIVAAAAPVPDLVDTSGIPLVPDSVVDPLAAPPPWAQALLDDVDPAGLRRLEVKAERRDALAALEGRGR